MSAKKESVLPQYWGGLSAGQITEGINVARQNARRLADDAKLLCDAGRIASATALAVLSIEESGKPLILRRLALATDGAKRKEAWKDFRRHTVKNRHWVLPGLVQGGARTLEALRSVVEGGEHAFLLDAIKQIALYADCFGERGNWSDPKMVIDRSLADEVVALANALALDAVVTEREVALWIECVGPHHEGPGMAHAVVAYQAALHREGLSKTHPEELAAFMGELLPVTSGA